MLIPAISTHLPVRTTKTTSGSRGCAPRNMPQLSVGEQRNEARYARDKMEAFNISSLSSEELTKILDEEDELKEFRSKFNIPYRIPGDESSGTCIYFCGNSLGCQSKNTVERVKEELDEWAKWGVEGHWKSIRPWLTTDEFVHEKMAKVVGAKPREVAVMNSLTVNMHLLLTAFYGPDVDSGRTKLVIERKAFPSDLYCTESQVRLHGLNPAKHLVQLTPKEGEKTLKTEDILDLIEREGESIACLCLAGVQYYTGQFFEIEKITKAAHDKGIIVGFDLAHAVGNIDLQLHDWNVDFASWCSYKYLNAGPGSIASIFVHEKWDDAISKGEQSQNAQDTPKYLPGTRLAGWWGHTLRTRFDMDAPFTPIPGSFGFRLSNPPVFQVASLLGSLEIFEEAGMDRLRKKSIRLTGYLEDLLSEDDIMKKHIKLLTPTEPSQRGCQLSLLFYKENAVNRINQKMIEEGVICDVRKPDVIRAAPVPLYNSFEDVRKFVSYLRFTLLEIEQQ